MHIHIIVFYYYLFDWCSKIFHFYDDAQHCGGRKVGNARGKPTTKCMMVADVPTNSRRGSGNELDLNSQLPHWWETRQALRCGRPLTDWVTRRPRHIILRATCTIKMVYFRWQDFSDYFQVHLYSARCLYMCSVPLTHVSVDVQIRTR